MVIMLMILFENLADTTRGCKGVVNLFDKAYLTNKLLVYFVVQNLVLTLSPLLRNESSISGFGGKQHLLSCEVNFQASTVLTYNQPTFINCTY